VNVIVLVIDTLRYDHVGANGNPRVRTPNMDGLASESWRFERCFSSSFPTIPHRLDVMTARYGAPFHTWMPLPYDWPTLPEAFAQAGYATQLIHDTPHLVNGGHHFDWPFHCWTFERGAEVDRPWMNGALEWPCNWAHDPLFDFVGQDWQPSPQQASYMRANRDRRDRRDWNAARVFGTAARFLRDNLSRDNFFLWVDCFDPHEPWDSPPEFVRMYDRRPGYDGRLDPRSFSRRNHKGRPAEADGHLRAQYAAKVTWMDHCLGEFLNAFEQTGLADRTALLLTADHGTRLGEFGFFGKGGRLPEQIGHVPLLIRPPGGELGLSSAIAQPQDFWATLAALAGVPVPAECDSQDLLAVARGGGAGARALAVAGASADGWPGAKGEPLFSVFTQDWVLELAADPARSSLYRYGDTENRAAQHPDVAGELHAAGIAEVERRGADPALVRWLRDGGAGEFPQDVPTYRGWPKPAGFRPYWTRAYGGD